MPECVSPWGPLMVGLAALLGLAVSAWHGLNNAAIPTQTESYQATASRVDDQWLGPADRLAFEATRADAGTPAPLPLAAGLAPWLADRTRRE